MWLLARRSLWVRPGRTGLFLLGFALAVCVMIALLSVGEAIVEQARDKDLVGGADLVLVPQGTDVDVLKLGGVGAMFQTVPNARFLYRQLLRGPRFAADVAAAAPTWAGRPVFLRAEGRVIQSVASATVPSLERATRVSRLPGRWHDTPGEARFATLEGAELYPEMDRWHLPAAAQPGARWAEWYYFNVLDPASGQFAYLSFFIAGDPSGPHALGSLSVQLGAPGAAPVRYAFATPVDTSAIALAGAGVWIGAGRPDHATVEVVRGTYLLSARFRDAATGVPVDVNLAIVPAPRAYYPPITLTGADGFASGYVVPAVIARAAGAITVGAARHEFAGAQAYHDHNWGVWKSVRWDWGQVQSPDQAFALVYGAIHAPELTQAGRGERYFAIVTGRDGFLGFLAPPAIEYGAWRAGPRVAGGTVSVPGEIRFAAQTEDDSLSVLLTVEDVTASLPLSDPRAEAPRLGQGRVFLQMRGRYQVSGRVGGRAVHFEAPGAAETFVPLPSATAGAATQAH